MDLLKLVKQGLSIVNTVTVKDEEITMWINAAQADLIRQGIKVDLSNNLVLSAIVMFVKGNFGNVDIKEKELSQKTYNLLCQNLSLSESYREVESNV